MQYRQVETETKGHVPLTWAKLLAIHLEEFVTYQMQFSMGSRLPYPLVAEVQMMVVKTGGQGQLGPAFLGGMLKDD